MTCVCDCRVYLVVRMRSSIHTQACASMCVVGKAWSREYLLCLTRLRAGCFLSRSCLRDPHVRHCCDRCERKKHPSGGRSSLCSEPPSPNLKVAVGRPSESAVAKKTPICAKVFPVAWPTLKLGGGRSGTYVRGTVSGWVFFSLAREAIWAF